MKYGIKKFIGKSNNLSCIFPNLSTLLFFQFLSFLFLFFCFFLTHCFLFQKRKKKSNFQSNVATSSIFFFFFWFFFWFFFSFLFWTVFFFLFCLWERKKKRKRKRKRKIQQKREKNKKKQRKKIVWPKLIEKIQMQTKNKIKEKKKKKNWICIGPILMEAWITKKKQEYLNSFSPPCQISRKKITPKIKISFSAKKFFFFIFYFCLIFVFGFCFLKDEKNRLLEIKKFLVFSMYYFYIKKEKWKTNLFFLKWER